VKTGRFAAIFVYVVILVIQGVLYCTQLYRPISWLTRKFSHKNGRGFFHWLPTPIAIALLSIPVWIMTDEWYTAILFIAGVAYMYFVGMVDIVRLPYDYLREEHVIDTWWGVPSYRRWAGPLCDGLLACGAIREEEVGHIASSFFYGLSVVVGVPAVGVVHTGFALLALSTGDVSARIVGKRWGRIRVGDKTLEGTLGFFVATLIVTSIPNVISGWSERFEFTWSLLVAQVVGTLTAAFFELFWPKSMGPYKTAYQLENAAIFWGYLLGFLPTLMLLGG